MTSELIGPNLRLWPSDGFPCFPIDAATVVSAAFIVNVYEVQRKSLLRNSVVLYKITKLVLYRSNSNRSSKAAVCMVVVIPAWISRHWWTDELCDCMRLSTAPLTASQPCRQPDS